jgi:DNA-binding NarL/FixJ family response regulator
VLPIDRLVRGTGAIPACETNFGAQLIDIRVGKRQSPLIGDAPWSTRQDTLFSALVIDSDPWLREAIAARLTQMGVGTVHEAATTAAARARTQTTDPYDLTILGLDPGDSSGIELVTELRSRGWRRIIVLASPDDPCTVPLTFQAGAQACLLKPTSLMSESFRPIPDSHARDLSAREVEVLQLVAAGHSNKEIGKKLNLSSLTIRSHLSRIGRKLGTGDRVRMVTLALRARIIR